MNHQSLQAYNRALDMEASGALTQAIKYYLKALSHHPRFFQASNNLAMVYRTQGRLELAKELLLRALNDSGSNAVVLNNIGILSRDLDNDSEAEVFFKRAILADDGYVPAYMNLATVLFDLGNSKSAINYLRKLEDKGISRLLTDILIIKSRFSLEDDSLVHEASNRVIQRLKLTDPSNEQQMLNILQEVQIDNVRECLPYYLVDLAYNRGMYQISDKLFDLIRNISGCENKLDLFLMKKQIRSGQNSTQVIKKLKKLIKNDPKNGECISLLIDALFWDGQVVSAFEEITRIPDGLSIISEALICKLFAFHAFDEAWQLQCQTRSKTRAYALQTTLNQSDVVERKLLVIFDEGIGDQVMLMTCLRDLLDEQPGAVFVSCDSRLQKVLARSIPQIQFHSTVEHGEFHSVVSMYALAARYRRTLDSFFKKGRIFISDDGLSKYWRKRLNELPHGLKIGFAWKGGGMSHSRLTRTKSMSLRDWEPLFQLSNIQWINLQYGDVKQELDAVIERCVNVHYFDDIDPMADVEAQLALISNLDLVIQVSNASIHFSGALGIPSWCLLGVPADFRWFSNGIDDRSAWYENVQLMRKEEGEEWADLVARIVLQLNSFRSKYD